ncbi:MAG TPA: acyl-ACP desaturase [Ktedonobacteraceae bacterium]|nr:acyl-ACP desaturase [Ktedonobacteraceae bacterium]
MTTTRDEANTSIDMSTEDMPTELLPEGDLPHPTRAVEMPNVVRGPWTARARQQAVERECHDAFVEYFGKAMRTRRWSPWHDLPFAEMQEHGHRLSEQTVNLVEGFLGVEEYVGDYVLNGLEMFRTNRTRRNLQLQWGSEEMKHGAAWELVLLHSGARSAEQLQEYCGQVAEHHWSIYDHAGADTPLGTAIYAMVQERATYFNYQETNARIREEYGLPRTRTPEERRRGFEVGAAEAFRVVSVDEIAHHGMFLQIVLIHLKYLPDVTLETMDRVFRGFRMPALRLIPHARTFLHAVVGAGLHKRERYQSVVHNPILKALGLDDDEAFNRAIQEAKLLPAGFGPDQITLGRSGEFVIS